MGASRKERQQWQDLSRAEAVALLRSLADRVEQDALEFAGEPTPLSQLRRVKFALRPEGDRVTVVQKLKVYPHPGPPATDTIPDTTPMAPQPPVEALDWKPLKRAMKLHFRQLHVAFRQGRLPPSAQIRWFLDASARQQELRGGDDPAFGRFADLARELYDAVSGGDEAAARDAWRELTGQHRACHRRRK